MSGCLYDLDTSGGLMDEIQALIAPPGSSKSNKKDEKKQQKEHPYFKRPGKGHNHDFCDACNEGGDLICCDLCPSSFHLGCHDPPLDFADIPQGKWLCHSCRYQKKGLLPRTFRKSSDSDGTPATKLAKKSPSKINPMEFLIEAAIAMNPSQFELPMEMNLPNMTFPGADKFDNPKLLKKLKQRDYERLPNGLVPLPARKCTECQKSCRVAPLVECDFCPAYFHLDCLDPPLTAPPTALWMCPLHVEHTLDSNMLTSVSLCERIQLWDKFSTPVDQDSVKLEFFRKIRRKNPPFRIKRKLPQIPKVQVPEMIKYHYRKPVALLPSLKDVLRIEHVYTKKKFTEAFLGMEAKENKEIEEESVDAEVKELLENDNKDIVEEKPCVLNQQETSPTPPIKSDNTANTPTPPPTSINITNNTYYMNNVVNVNVGSSKNGNTLNIIREKAQLEMNNGYYETELLKKEEIVIKDIMDGYFSIEAEQDLKQLDERLIKILAHQRLQQLIGFGNLNTLKMPLPSELLTPADIERISRAFASPKKKPQKVNRSTVRARAMLCPIVSKHFYNVRTREVDPTDVRHDASFMGFRPTVSTRFPEAVAMRYRVLNIGKGSSNDVDLEKFGYCNFIAPKHSVIFFDDYTKSYELINYAPYGTYVNNVLYSNNVCINRIRSNRDPPKEDFEKNVANLSPEEKAACVESQVRGVIGKKRKCWSDSVKMAAPDWTDRVECCCSSNFGGSAVGGEDLKNGWEGSAILNHGSLIKFGCISFVFSIVDNSII